MGLLVLNRLMSMQPGRRRRPTQGRNGLVTSVAKRKDSPCLQDDNYPSDKKVRYSGPTLPEAIWHHIYSLLPLRDAARVACVSHSFRTSWRCFPNLSLTRETLGLDGGVDRKSYKISEDLARITDHILKNHSGICVKALKLEICDYPYVSTSCDLDRWLHIVVKPGIEELELRFHPSYDVYNFPCSLIDGSSKSIQQLHLHNCAVRPTAGLGCLRRLTSLELYFVCITGDELSCLLSCSVALEKLTLMYCDELISLEMPSLLQRLSHLFVSCCSKLEVIKIKAPNLYSFDYSGTMVPLSLGDSLKNLRIAAVRQDTVHYACADLPRMVPHLEDLHICSLYPRDTLVVPGKFLHLKGLCIWVFTPDYDYLSLVSFLDACPSLEDFTLYQDPDMLRQESVLGYSSHDLRQMPGHVLRNLKDVEIAGFCSAKSIVELTCHILENASSLEYLELSVSYSHDTWCSEGDSRRRCIPMSRREKMESRRALLAVERYILEKVPSTVELEVVKPCSRCNSLDIKGRNK